FLRAAGGGRWHRDRTRAERHSGVAAGSGKADLCRLGRQYGRTRGSDSRRAWTIIVIARAASEGSVHGQAGFSMPPSDPIWLVPLARTSSALNYAAALIAAIILAAMVVYVLGE